MHSTGRVGTGRLSSAEAAAKPLSSPRVGEMRAFLPSDTSLSGLPWSPSDATVSTSCPKAMVQLAQPSPLVRVPLPHPPDIGHRRRGAVNRAWNILPRVVESTSGMCAALWSVWMSVSMPSAIERYEGHRTPLPFRAGGLLLAGAGADGSRILDLIANQLHELSYKDMCATSLKPKHVEPPPRALEGRVRVARNDEEPDGDPSVVVRKSRKAKCDHPGQRAHYGIPDRIYVSNVSKARELTGSDLQRPDLGPG